MSPTRGVTIPALIAAWHSPRTIEELSAAFNMTPAAIHNAWSDLKKAKQLPNHYRTKTGVCSKEFSESQRSASSKQVAIDGRGRVDDIASEKETDPLLARLNRGMR